MPGLKQDYDNKNFPAVPGIYYTRALHTEKSKSPLFPDYTINDWCIWDKAGIILGPSFDRQENLWW